MLTRFESLFRREAWDQAARACEEALVMEGRIGAGGHGQIIDLWRDLLALVESQRLTADRVLEARHALVRHCNSPALRARPASHGTFLRWDANGTPAPGATSQPIALPSGPTEPLFAVEPPALPVNLAGGGFHEALEHFECQLIAAGLARCGGRIKPAARLLGMSRTALREKARKYGLSAAA